VLAAVVAGGLGSRMGASSARTPKPMLPIGGVPLILRQLRLLAREGCTQATVHTGHLAETMEAALRAEAPAGLSLRFVRDPFPAGSGGCLRHGGEPADDLLVLFGDVMLDMDLRALLASHRDRGAHITAVVHPNRHPHDSDLVDMAADGLLRALHRKPHPPGLRVRNQATAGAFVLSPAAWRAIPPDRPADLVHDLVTEALARGRPVYGYHSTEYLKDMGTPARYRQVQGDWERGLIQAMHRARRRPAAILRERALLLPDRSGLQPGAARALRSLGEAGVLLALQPTSVLPEGSLAALDSQLGREGAFLDAVLPPTAAPLEAAADRLPVDRDSSRVLDALSPGDPDFLRLCRWLDSGPSHPSSTGGPA
jgi:mannose-1-phosphate guanylyltransferase/phosphomannomutase